MEQETYHCVNDLMDVPFAPQTATWNTHTVLGKTLAAGGVVSPRDMQVVCHHRAVVKVANLQDV